MRIETDGSRKRVLGEQVLCEEHYAHVPVMRSFREEIRYGLIRFVHEVVDHQQHRLAAVKVVQVGKSLMKDDSRIHAKQLLIFSITVNYHSRRRIYHAFRAVD